MLTPDNVRVGSDEYTRIVNNSTEYLAQNFGDPILIVGSDEDLGATTATDLGGYYLETYVTIGNVGLKNKPYVYAKAFSGSSNVRI